MGGSMYQPATDNPARDAARKQRASRAEDFGEFAVCLSLTDPGPSSISGPSKVEAGIRVAANFADTNKGALCLITLIPAQNLPMRSVHLVDLLANELTNFACSHMVPYGDDVAAALGRASAQPASIRINGIDAAGWSLQHRELLGLVAHTGNRVYMWLSTNAPEASLALTTEDLGAHLRTIRGK
ncbi:hypothetical protein [Paenarthrobacter nitroguajacolicus]|uniref:hypothetical protein n=1 Tax=Paenarthrobacter nitroguajacolicus TaxID=211146 RepID=UPI0028553F75|nr:hypothetical protein [Paenarthrobacter nitroguajacolicus]MDR6637395.1 hypothetical protein [Paenarthrobacter nitroguajacolicus]